MTASWAHRRNPARCRSWARAHRRRCRMTPDRIVPNAAWAAQLAGEDATDDPARTVRVTPAPATSERAALAWLAVALAGVAVAGCTPQPSLRTDPAQPEASADTAVAVFAFTTATELSIVRGDVIVATVHASAEPAHPVFTPTGRFAAATTADGDIITTGIHPNTTRTIPADALQVFSDHGDTITWWQSPNQLVSLDLSQPSAEPVATPVDLPGGTPKGSRLVSLSARTAVFARPGMPGEPEQLIRMDRKRNMRALAPSPEIANPIRVTVPSFNGGQFAYTAPLRAACPKDGVSVVDIGTGQTSSAPMPYAIDDRATTQRVWWDFDGLLHMSVATRPCTSDAGSESVTSWKLEHNTWVRAEPDDVLVSRQLGGPTVAVVKPARLKPAAGALWLNTETASTHIADDVTDLAAPGIPTIADLADVLPHILHPRDSEPSPG